MNSHRSLAPRALYFVGPLLGWMLFIFFLSTDKASADNTNPLVNQLLHRLFPWLADHFTLAMQSRIDWNIRKTAHVSEYSVLSILAFRAIRFGSTHFRSRNVALPLLLCILYAASDEYHQSFVPSRGAAAADVFYDTFGILAGMVLCLWFTLLRKRQTEP